MPEPKRYTDAVTGRHSELWREAILKEVENLQSHGVWKWVWLPEGARCIDATWRFKVKITNAGLVDKLKARLCARGFKEIFGKDYIETHAPVTVLTSFRIALAEAAR